MISASKHIEATSDLYSEFIKSCQYILKQDPIAAKAREYLNQRLDLSVQDKYQFGYFPQDSNLGFLTSIFDKEKLEQLSLLYPKYISGGSIDHGHFHNHNLVMPFYNSYGNIISILGRTLVSDEEQKELNLQKYKYTLNAKKNLHVFGLDKAKSSILSKNCVICVEGQFDYIACQEAGIHNVIALGWANMSKYQFFALRRFTNNFILLLDNDEPGLKARKKITDKYSQYANFIGPKVPGPFKDIDECLRNDPEAKTIVQWLNINLPKKINK